MNMTWPKPIISLGSVEISSIDIKSKSIRLNIHINCLPSEMNSDSMKNYAEVMADRKLRYLMDEGFTTSMKGWQVKVDRVGHPPKNKI